MKLYEFEEVRDKSNCKDVFINILGAKEISKGRFTAPWRKDSDSGSVAVNNKTFYDHVMKESGSSLDAVMLTRQCTLIEAGSILGEYYKINPIFLVTKNEVNISTKIVEIYNYCDNKGQIRYQVVRYEPKTFKQRVPLSDGKFSWNMKNVELLPYRFPEWEEKKSIIIVEGEQDVNNLHKLGFPATTFTGGAGRWKDHYLPFFQGKNLCIMHDNDEPGINHANQIARKLCKTCKKIKVICPSNKKSGDITDFIEQSKSPTQDIKDLIAKTPLYVAELELSEIKDPVDKAKMANTMPFSNVKEEMEITSAGKEKKVKTPLIMNEMIQNINNRFLDFPRRQGSSIFDHDRKTDQIRFINDPPALFSWIGEKSNQPVMWDLSRGAASKTELFNAIYANSIQYNAISHIPSFPMRDDVYYTFKNLPEPCPLQSRLEKFCSFFAPSEEVDKYLLKVLIASVIYYRDMAKRPLWIIDSSEGKGVGKTTLIEMICRLLEIGGDKSPITSSMSAINDENQYSRLEKELLSISGRRKRILLIDNEDGVVKSSRLCSMVTCEFFSGMSPYAKECESRPNDLTYVITSNDAIISDDISKRSIILELKTPKKYAQWSQQVISYIESCRFCIFADILSLLKNPVDLNVQTTRFEAWDTDIFMPIIRNKNVVNDIWKSISIRNSKSNIDSSEAELINTCYQDRIVSELKLNHEQNCIFVQSNLAIFWYRQAIETRISDTGIIRKIRTMIREKHLINLSEKWAKYPIYDGNARRGITWNIQNCEQGVYIAGLNEGRGKLVLNYD